MGPVAVLEKPEAEVSGGAPWEEWEDDLIREAADHNAIPGVDSGALKAIVREGLLPGRTHGAVKQRAWGIGARSCLPGSPAAVAKLLREGLKHREIAKRLRISEEASREAARLAGAVKRRGV